MRKFLIGAALAALSAAASAAPTYIHAGRVIAVPGASVLGPSTIIVDDGRIQSVQAGHLAAPAGAELIDLKDKTVLPGLIDSHVHGRRTRREAGCGESAVAGPERVEAHRTG